MTTATDQTARNREILTRLYDAGIAGDVETFFSLLDPSFTVNEPPFLSYGGVYEGVDAFKALFASVGDLLDLPSISLESLTVEGDRAFAVITTRVRATGDPVALCEEWQLRDGLITSARVWWWDSAPVVQS